MTVSNTVESRIVNPASKPDTATGVPRITVDPAYPERTGRSIKRGLRKGKYQKVLFWLLHEKPCAEEPGQLS